MLAARSHGFSSLRIIFQEMLPNALPSIIVTTSVMVASSILIESALAFLGFGDHNRVSWGSMIGAGRESLRTAWFFTALPGGALVLTVLSLNLVGDALNDALNPPFAQESIMTSLLTINDLRVTFPGHDAVRGLNLTLNAGETLALVGESGCGKSAIALSLMRLLPDSARLQGEILFDGQNLLTLSDAQMRQRRGNQLSMIFQEPMTSLNPVLSIGQQIAETLHVHQQLTPVAARKRAIELLDLVRIPEPARRVDDYPHNLSGGQRQRVMIAMAVACQPRLFIADEPTTALDVTIQAQILALLDRLRRELSMGLLLITHDLGLVSQWADRVAVMYAGQKVEEAATAQLFSTPQHPYTRGLLGTSLHMDQDMHYRDSRLPEIHHQPEAQGSAFTLITPPPLVHSPRQTDQQPLLSLCDVHTEYQTAQGKVSAVNGVSLDIHPGETLGLVGESGCGKSTLSKTILRLLPTLQGNIIFDGEDITHHNASRLASLRQRVQMIFQDPYT